MEGSSAGDARIDSICKYCDKIVDAQAGSHVCIWWESACVLMHMLKQTVSVEKIHICVSFLCVNNLPSDSAG